MHGSPHAWAEWGGIQMADWRNWCGWFPLNFLSWTRECNSETLGSFYSTLTVIMPLRQSLWSCFIFGISFSRDVFLEKRQLSKSCQTLLNALKSPTKSLHIISTTSIISTIILPYYIIITNYITITILLSYRHVAIDKEKTIRNK